MISFQNFLAKYPARHFDQGEILIMQGTIPRAVYIIKSGFVKGYDINANGVEQIVWFGRRFDVFPIAWTFDLVEENPYFYSTFSEAEIHLVPRDDFMHFIKKDSTALFALTNQLAKHYFDLLQHLNAAEKPKADEKLIHTLYYISLKFTRSTRGERVEVSLPLTHQDIANLVGLTRETVAVELKKLKDKGYIYYDKWHFVVYRDKLAGLL
jgi:CRP/FNR family transcriptional regulator, cyclic AMP receptor protein